MDWSAIGGIAASITAARDIAKGIAAARDATLINEKTAALLEQLLKAQEGLLSHNSTLLQLQGEYFQAREELRKLQEAIGERGSYALFELAPGQFAYRVNVAPQAGGASEPGTTQPLHYVCQPCFDAGRKCVLRISDTAAFCSVCKSRLPLKAASAAPASFAPIDGDSFGRNW